MRPIIALTGDSLVTPSAITNLNYADMAPQMLKNALIKVGGLPIILPFPDDLQVASELAAAAVQTFDGLVLPGGPDVDPTLYGEEPINASGRVTYPKDIFELALIKHTLQAHKPILGICRGLQILNVALGGTLYQDLPTQNQQATIKHTQASQCLVIVPSKYSTAFNWSWSSISCDSALFDHESLSNLGA